MEIDQLFQRFGEKRIAVLGDVMIDSYIWGNVQRISPEAPVPIVQFAKGDKRLGGAANVALNLMALGATSYICSVVGTDTTGNDLLQLLTENGISTEGIYQSDSRKTTLKTRVIGNQQQLLRIDTEQTDAITSSEENHLFQKVKALIESGIDALIFEDYNKGILTPSLIQDVINLCNANGVITTVDPKKDNFFAYRGVSLFKPNLKELKEGIGVQFSILDRPNFELAVQKLEKQLGNEISFITLSEHGVFIKDAMEKHYIPAHLRNITDVSGAGDTVISVATLCLSCGLSLKNVAEIANLSGGLVCEKSGVVHIDKKDLAQEMIKLNIHAV